MKTKHLIIFGTRPEAIKMAPLVKEYKKYPEFDTKVCVTAQHREMLDQVLDFFLIKPDFDLDLMKPDQNLYSLTANIITGLKPILEDFHKTGIMDSGGIARLFMDLIAMAITVGSFFFISLQVLITKIELDICKNDISISFYILWFCLYLNVALKNYKTDES